MKSEREAGALLGRFPLESTRFRETVGYHGGLASLCAIPRAVGSRPPTPSILTMPNQEWITVYVAASEAEAQILAGLLISEGLQARVAGEQLSDEFGMAMRMGPVEVGVPSHQATQAKDIVAAWVARESDS